MSLDANCRFCGEPWDIYEFHSFPNYNKAVKAFQKYGCGMFDADADDLDSASKQQPRHQPTARRYRWCSARAQ